MKKLILVSLVSFVFGYLSTESRSVQAYPGGFCVDASGCGKCEVCVKATGTAPTGKCMAIAGCY